MKSFLPSFLVVLGLTACAVEEPSFSELRSQASLGNMDAQVALADIYRHGSGVDTNPIEAARWFRTAANQGSVKAQRILGLMYRDGVGIPRWESEAIKWLRKAVEGNDVEAQNALIFMYRKELGNPDNYIQWARNGANNGRPWGEFMLGSMYNWGLGFGQDSSTSVEWFRRAAEQDYPQGQIALGKQYATGWGVQQDLVEAYKWFSLAADHGLDEANALTNNWGRRMTRAQIAEAKKLASEWKSRRR